MPKPLNVFQEEYRKIHVQEGEYYIGAGIFVKVDDGAIMLREVMEGGEPDHLILLEAEELDRLCHFVDEHSGENGEIS